MGNDRPSLAQVAARDPINSKSPMRPAKIGRTPMPRTTLASRIFRPIQSSPLKVVLVRTGTIRGTLMRSPSATRRASPPVALVNASSTSVVEVTSANSRGLAGPTFVRAVSLPSVARQRPSSLAVIAARHSPGSPCCSSI